MWWDRLHRDGQAKVGGWLGGEKSRCVDRPVVNRKSVCVFVCMCVYVCVCFGGWLGGCYRKVGWQVGAGDRNSWGIGEGRG